MNKQLEQLEQQNKIDFDPAQYSVWWKDRVHSKRGIEILEVEWVDNFFDLSKNIYASSNRERTVTSVFYSRIICAQKTGFWHEVSCEEHRMHDKRNFPKGVNIIKNQLGWGDSILTEDGSVIGVIDWWKSGPMVYKCRIFTIKNMPETMYFAGSFQDYKAYIPLRVLKKYDELQKEYKENPPDFFVCDLDISNFAETKIQRADPFAVMIFKNDDAKMHKFAMWNGMEDEDLGVDV